MAAHLPPVPSPAPTKHDAKDLEPDEQWKTQLKARIQLSLASLVNEAKQSRKGAVRFKTRVRLKEEYNAAMAKIESMASQQYEAELEKERNRRLAPILTHSRPVSPPAPMKPDPMDLEPDEEWKTALKARIQNSLPSLVNEAKQNQLTELRKGVVSSESRERLHEEYKAAMANIKSMASEQYAAELEKERNQRRWIAGEPTAPGWEKILLAEQQLILNSIRQTQTPTTPIDAAAMNVQPRSEPYSLFHPPRTPESTSARAPETILSSLQRRLRRRETEPPITVTDQKPTSRHGSERRPAVPSNNRNDEQHPHTRRMNGSSSSSSMARERPAAPWLSNGTRVDEPPYPRTRTSDKVSERPWESSLSRASDSAVRSLSLSEHGLPSRTPQLARWGSRPTPSDAPLHPDGPSTSAVMNNDRGHSYGEQLKHLPMPAPTPYIDAGDPRYAPLREPPYTSRDMARPPARSPYDSNDSDDSDKSDDSDDSDKSDDSNNRGYPRRARAIPPRSPYNSDDPREREYIPQRGLPASRPPAARNDYPPEERDYHTPPSRMNGASKSAGPPPPFISERDYTPSPTLPPIHKPPFSYPRWDDQRERDVQWEEERELREREATYARELREREARDRIERERDLRERERDRERERERAREQRERQNKEDVRHKDKGGAWQVEEARILAEELKRKEAEAVRLAEEVRKIEEEAERKAEEARKREEEAKQKEAEAKKKEHEVTKREQEAKKRAEDVKRLEEEAKRKETELKKKEEATRKCEEKLRQESEETKQMQQEAQNIAEDAKEKQEELTQLEEETRKREREIREREEALLLHELEFQRREEEACRREEDAKRLAEEQEKEAEVKRIEVEAQRKVEEGRQSEQLWQQDETRKQLDDLAKKELDLNARDLAVAAREQMAAKIVENAWKLEEAAKQMQNEAKQIEQDIQTKVTQANNPEQRAKEYAASLDEEAKRRITALEKNAEHKLIGATKIEEAARRKEIEVRNREEAVRKREERLKQDFAKAKQLRQEAQTLTQEATQKNDKLLQFEENLVAREKELQRREEQVQFSRSSTMDGASMPYMITSTSIRPPSILSSHISISDREQYFQEYQQHTTSKKLMRMPSTKSSMLSVTDMEAFYQEKQQL